MADDQPTSDASRAPEAVAADLSDLLGSLTRELHGQSARGKIGLDDALERDLGIDSLARVELLHRLERRFDVAISDQVYAAAETPRDLLRAVLAASARGSEHTLALQVEALGHERGGDQPEAARTLLEVLEWHCARHPERRHIRLFDAPEEPEITYADLREGALRMAAGLQARGVRPGEMIAIMLPTGRDYFFSFYGILMAGAVPVPLYPPARPTQLEDHLGRQAGILDSCRAVLLITVPEALKLARLIKPRVPSLRQLETPKRLVGDVDEYRPTSVKGQDIAFLQYTSGSTGNPKGVILTHDNLLANIRADGQGIGAEATDVFVSWLPLYHDMGLIGAWLGSLYFALPLVIMSPLHFLTRPVRWLQAIHRHRGTLSAAPNFAYELCLSRIEDSELEGLDLSSWRIAFNGAEPVSPKTLMRFTERFAPYGFRREAMYPVYGLAECSVGLAFPPLGRGPLIDRIERDTFMRNGRAVPVSEDMPDALEFVACGGPLSGHEIRVVDDTGNELPERREGRVQFRGPSTTSGYYRNPEATRRLFHDDWLDSGDRGYMVDGEIHLTGRAKDVILRAGRNVYPQELEEAVGKLPGIRTGLVAVFGSEDRARGTERLVVLAETRSEDPAERERLVSEIRALGSDLVGVPPDDVVLAPPGTVLKTSSGKIRRAASRDLYESGRIGKGPRSVWLQFLRLAAAGIAPRLRRVKGAVGAYVYAAWVWVAFALVAGTGWLLAMVLPGLSRRRRVARVYSRFLARLTGVRIGVEGREFLPDDGAHIFASNHASYIDGLVLTAVLPPGFGFVAKAELRQSFFVHSALKRMGVHFVERFDKQKGIGDARRIGEAVQRGEGVLFFAEGTMTRSPGLLPFQMGAFVAAAEANHPVVPVALRGTRFILRPGFWFPRPGSVTVTIGPPLAPEDMPGESPWERALGLRAVTREFVLKHCGEPDAGRGREAP
jgi:1-acyl-sn-glycerol-3-phosphate acyltransferase